METLIEANQEDDQKKARVGAIIWIILLFMILIFPFMTIPNPPPGQEGIIVNLGLIDIGEGDENAPIAEANEATSEPEAQETPEEETKPEPEEKPKEEPKKEKKPVKKEQKKPEKVKVKETKKVIEDNSKELALQKKKAEAEARKKAEKAQKAKEAQEQQKAADRKAKQKADEARKKAEAEARRKAEVAALKAAEKARKEAEALAEKNEADNLKSGLSGLFGGGKGNTGEEGNQGTKDGSPDSDILEGISTGAGKVGGGLSSRGGKGPKITDNSQATGTVVVKVCVDSSGRVVSSKYTQGGSTTSNPQLVKLAEANARSWSFKAGELDKTCGTITYDFKVK